MTAHVPYVVLPRAGLVHSLCPLCRGDGRSDYCIGESVRETMCAYCAGTGYIVTESPTHARATGVAA